MVFIARRHWNQRTKRFFFTATPNAYIYTLSLHDALPIFEGPARRQTREFVVVGHEVRGLDDGGDRKSTRLNSSHSSIAYAVVCLKKKRKLLKNFLSVLVPRPPKIAGQLMHPDRQFRDFFV